MEAKEIFPFTIENNILIGKQVSVEDKDISIGELILNTLKSQPNFVAQVDATTKKEITFQEIRNKSVRLAIWMTTHGVCLGDTIAISSGHYAIMYAFLACLYIGAVPVLWSEKYPFENSATLIFNNQHSVIFIDDILAYALLDDIIEKKLNHRVIVFDTFPAFLSYSELEPYLDITHKQTVIDNFICAKLDKSRKDIAALLCTRGVTTGNTVEISHAIFTAAVNQQVFDMLPGDVGMWVGSFSSLTNIIFAVHSILSFKRTIRFMGYWRQGVCQTIEKYKVNWILLETHMCKEMVHFNVFEEYDFSSLKMLIYTGSPMPYGDHRNLIMSLPNTSIVSLYGTTETGIISCQVKTGKFTSSGYVGKNVGLKIIDLYYGQTLGPNKCGEILCICKGATNEFDYFGEMYQKMFEISGWFRTGDVGYYDEDGEIFVTDRVQNFIFFKDIWYSPTIVENVISRISAVDEVAVVSVVHAKDGDYSVAYITTRRRRKISAKEVRDEVKNKLCDHMRLRAGVVVLQSMPYELDGSISRSTLRRFAYTCLEFNPFSARALSFNDSKVTR